MAALGTDTRLTFTVRRAPGGRPSEVANWFAEELARLMVGTGHRFEPDLDPSVRLVFHLVDPQEPRPYRRKAQATFVVAVAEGSVAEDKVFEVAYPLLVRTISNLILFLVPSEAGLTCHFVTLEQGSYAVRLGQMNGHSKESFFQQVYHRLAPLASSQLVIDNLFVPDLPLELWNGDEVSGQLSEAGRRLDALNLLPAPFPIDTLLTPRDLRHVMRLFGLGGLSYGNLSARRDQSSFWMSASGVNKGRLQEIGRDILLVTGFDEDRHTMRLSVPRGVRPRRVSVDAIEHLMIYREHPQVGAIVHVHAWIDGVVATEVNYPCGTLELATAVADLVRRAPDPARAIVGLQNHGLTITGPSLANIFDRIEGRILPQVPMV